MAPARALLLAATQFVYVATGRYSASDLHGFNNALDGTTYSNLPRVLEMIASDSPVTSSDIASSCISDHFLLLAEAKPTAMEQPLSFRPVCVTKLSSDISPWTIVSQDLTAPSVDCGVATPATARASGLEVRLSEPAALKRRLTLP